MDNFKNAFIQYGLDHGHIKPIKETIKKYKIIKFRKSGTQKVMETNLSLDEAKDIVVDRTPKAKIGFVVLLNKINA